MYCRVDPFINIAHLSEQVFTGTGRPVVPGQGIFLVPVSLCPVEGQGQEQKSRDKLLCPGTSQDKMNIYLFNCTKKFSEKMTRFPVLECLFPVLEHPFLF